MRRSICLITLLALFLTPLKGLAQVYTVSGIPDSLKRNANSVVRLQELHFYQKNDEDGNATGKQVVTILNSKGKEAAIFIYVADRFRSLSNFSGKIYDANGKMLRKIKKSELQRSELSQHLASDDLTYFYECPYSSYPFTIEFEYEIHYKKGLPGYPPFVPIEATHQSLEQGVYTLDVPQKVTLRAKTENANFQTKTSEQENRRLYTWTLQSYPAKVVRKQDLPFVYALPEEFVYDGYKGRYTSWKELGMWHHLLQENRTTLPEATVNKIRELTSGLSSDRDKIQALYDYLGKQTRYVSIQLGIGGLQPMPAAEVAQTQFGDCKALSNYLQAMLQAIGIPSHYTIISTERKRLYADFPNLFQCNHVILCVPQAKDTLWLECTNPRIPFGYTHHYIAGHDALVVTEEGGKFVCLPHLPDSLQKQSLHARLHYIDGKMMQGEVTYRNENRLYEEKSSLLQKDTKEQYEATLKELGSMQVRLSNLHFAEKKAPTPSLTCQYQMTGICGRSAGSRLFVPINPFRNFSSPLSETSPGKPLLIEDGYTYCDTLEVELPQGYTVESMPRPIHYLSPFGSFHSEIKAEAGKYTVFQRISLQSGEYAESLRKQLAEFCQTVQSGYSATVIVKMSDQ